MVLKTDDHLTTCRRFHSAPGVLFLAQVERGEYWIIPEEQGAQINATMMQFAKAVTREVKAEGVGKKNREEDEAPSSPTSRCTFTLELTIARAREHRYE